MKRPLVKEHVEEDVLDTLKPLDPDITGEAMMSHWRKLHIYTVAQL